MGVPARRIVLHLAFLIALSLPAFAAQAGGIAGRSSTGTLYVDDNARPGGDGLSWGAAFPDLQAALDAAAKSKGGKSSIAEIHVAQGNYLPTKRVDLADPRSATFTLQDNLAVIGGFAGVGNANPDARNVAKYPTILSGDLAGDDGPLSSFTNMSENAYHVVSANEVDDTAYIDGFTIQSGSGCCGIGQFDPNAAGAGLIAIDSDVMVANCTFIGNQAEWHGGAIYVEAGSPTLMGLAIVGNRGVSNTGQGGGLFSEAAQPVLIGCSFVGNVARGGGINQHLGSVSLTGCSFSENSSVDFAGGGAIVAVTGMLAVTDSTFEANLCEGYGGAMQLEEMDVQMTGCSFVDNESGDFDDGGAIGASSGGTCSIDSSTFSGNHATIDGGAIYMGVWTSTITDCTFVGNTAAYNAGAIRNSSQLTVRGCVFTDNHAPGASAIINDSFHSMAVIGSQFTANTGGGAAVAGGTAVINCGFYGNQASNDWAAALGMGGAGGQITNCTFRSNVSGFSNGAAIYLASQTGSFIVTNCVLWGNAPNQIRVPVPGTASVSHSDLQGGWSGPGSHNISLDPHFSGPGLLTLLANSPCNDAGNNAVFPMDISTDIAGNPRFVDDPLALNTGAGVSPLIDMGCYEFQPSAGFCPADCAVPHDGSVNIIDLQAVLNAWGMNSPTADLNASGTVDIDDLLLVIAAWGPCGP